MAKFLKQRWLQQYEEQRLHKDPSGPLGGGGGGALLQPQPQQQPAAATAAAGGGSAAKPTPPQRAEQLAKNAADSGPAKKRGPDAARPGRCGCNLQAEHGRKDCAAQRSALLQLWRAC